MGRIKGVKTGPYHITKKQSNKILAVEEDRFRNILENSANFSVVFEKIGCGFMPMYKQELIKRADDLGIDITHLWKGHHRLSSQPRNKVYEVTDDHFRDIVANSSYIGEIVEKIGCKHRPFYKKEIKERADKLGIDLTHIVDGRLLAFGGSVMKLDMDLKNKRGPTTLRNLLKSSERPYICENCNCEDMTMGDNGEWQWKGRDLALEINHRYGHGFEGCNDPIMLQYLCPACHRQHTNLLISAKSALKNRFTA